MTKRLDEKLTHLQRRNVVSAIAGIDGIAFMLGVGLPDEDKGRDALVQEKLGNMVDGLHAAFCDGTRRVMAQHAIRHLRAIADRLEKELAT